MFVRLTIPDNDHVDKTMEFLNRHDEIMNGVNNWRGILELCNISTMTHEDWFHDPVNNIWKTRFETWDGVFGGLRNIRKLMFPNDTKITMHLITSSNFCYYTIPYPYPAPKHGWTVPRTSNVVRDTPQFPQIKDLWIWMWSCGLFPYGDPENRTDMTSITPRPSNDDEFDKKLKFRF